MVLGIGKALLLVTHKKPNLVEVRVFLEILRKSIERIRVGEGEKGFRPSMTGARTLFRTRRFSRALHGVLLNWVGVA